MERKASIGFVAAAAVLIFGTGAALAQQSVLTVPGPRAPAKPALVEGAGVALDRAGVERIFGATPAQSRQALSANVGQLQELLALELVTTAVFRDAVNQRVHERPEVRAAAERAAQTAIANAFVEQEIDRQIGAFPTDADLRQAYESNRAQLVKPVELEVSQFTIPAPADGPERNAALQRATEAQARAAANRGASFSDVALQNNGQSMGWVPVNILTPLVRAAIENAQPGTVSNVIELPSAFVVVRVQNRRGGDTMSFEEAQPMIREQLTAQRREQLRLQVLGQRIQGAPYRVVDEAGLTAAIRGR